MLKNIQNIFHVQSFRWIWVISAIIWFALLGYRNLIEPDEGRYAEIPREMVASGDWVTPRLDGFKYFEKPALQYWTTAISYELFGESNVTARLWLALIGFLGAIWAGFVGARLFGLKVGNSAFIITLSSLLYVVGGHYLTLDMSVSVFMAMGIGSLALAQTNRSNPKNCRNWMLIGWASLALAVLSKGLIGLVLPGAAVVLYSIWQRDWQLWKYLHIGKGLIVFLAITVPWFVKVSLDNPEFAHFFFIHEHWDRYTTTIHHRNEPWYYFIPIFLLGSSPWVISSLKALFTPDFKWCASSEEGFNPLRFFWTYIIFVIVFFSLGDSKLHLYILPVFPFVAILAAHKVVKTNSLQGERWVILFLSLFFLVGGIIITRFASDNLPVFIWAEYRPWILAAALCYGLATVLLFRWRSKPYRVMGMVGLLALLGAQCIIWGSGALGVSRSSKDIAAAIQAFSKEPLHVYAVEGSYPQSLPFYLNRKVLLVAYKGELAMGIDAEPKLWIPDAKAFAARWAKEKQAFAVFDNNDFPKYQQMGLPMKIIYTNPRRTVVVKP
jgi:4-amino-4-deoxy-L-arabinose transferase-like glycosyltransferase